LTLPYSNTVFLLRLASAFHRVIRSLHSCLADPFSHDQTTVKPHLRTKTLEGIGGVCSEVLDAFGGKDWVPHLAITCSRQLHFCRWKASIAVNDPTSTPSTFPAATKPSWRSLYHLGSLSSLLSYKTQSRSQQSAGPCLRHPALRLSAHPRGCASGLNGLWLVTVLGFHAGLSAVQLHLKKDSTAGQPAYMHRRSRRFRRRVIGRSS
jgi:hypothetical protein